MFAFQKSVYQIETLEILILLTFHEPQSDNQSKLIKK